jgi:hypothetical protein
LHKDQLDVKATDKTQSYYGMRVNEPLDHKKIKKMEGEPDIKSEGSDELK